MGLGARLWVVAIPIEKNKLESRGLNYKDRQALKAWYRVQKKINPKYSLSYNQWVKYQTSNYQMHERYLDSSFLNENSRKYVKISLVGTMNWFFPKEKARIANKAMTDLTNYINLIYKYDWAPDIAVAIMMGESKGNKRAEAKSDWHRTAQCRGSFGLFQVGCLWFESLNVTKEDLMNPEINIEAAYKIYQKNLTAYNNGFLAWTVYNKDTYKKYLNKDLLTYYYKTARFNWSLRKGNLHLLTPDPY